MAFPGTRVSALPGPAPGGRGRHGDGARGNGPRTCARRALTSPQYRRPQGGAAPARGAGRGWRGRRVRAGSPILPVVSGARARPWSGAGAAAAGTEGGRREREKGARPPGPRPAGTARTAGEPRGEVRPGGLCVRRRRRRVTGGSAVRGGADPSAAPAERSAVPALPAARSGKGKGGEGKAVRRAWGCGGCQGLARGRPSTPRPGPPSTGRAGAAVPGPCQSGGSRPGSPLEQTAQRREGDAAVPRSASGAGLC